MDLCDIKTPQGNDQVIIIPAVVELEEGGVRPIPPLSLRLPLPLPPPSQKEQWGCVVVKISQGTTTKE